MKHLTTNKSILAILIAAAFTFQACDDKVEDPVEPNEEELITSVEIAFTDLDPAGDTRFFKFADLDGDGGNGPTQFDTIRLKANSNYLFGVKFLDESSDDVELINSEIQEEADEHLVCYTVTGGTTVTITDKDGNGLDLGLTGEVTTTDAGNGNFTISLKHQPDVKDGSCDVGETDVEVRFVLEIE